MTILFMTHFFAAKIVNYPHIGNTFRKKVVSLQAKLKIIMKKSILTLAVCCGWMAAMAQTYQVPVSEQHEQMLTGSYEPT